MSKSENGHSFYIPVMGTAFTIDTPLKVAKFGISSVISLVDDVLIEQMRKYHSEEHGEPYEEIKKKSKDGRARRITLYLNLIHKLVQKQIDDMRSSPFDEGSDIVRYFELLPDVAAKKLYSEMLVEKNENNKLDMQSKLKSLIAPGTIDVNIMTKLDRDTYIGKEKQPPEFADALAALRGYANSDVRSSMIFSAGMNLRLFSYIAKFDDFFPDKNGDIKKKIVLKVSDYRSAEIQGKFLAKRGIWVSEYRVESGLNCGGHAFATTGYLMGPVLHEFKLRKKELIDKLFTICNKVLSTKERLIMSAPPPVRITVQGGIGTHEEDELLRKYYEVDRTGWGTPFLLVPEVTNVDDRHIDKLKASTEKDIFLSSSSPLGIPFWNLRNSSSEDRRQEHIDIDRPGSLCPKGFLVSTTEFTNKPICRASRAFQSRKLVQLETENFPIEQMTIIREDILSKSCICHDLSGAVKVKLGIESDALTAICPGPNIVNFSRIASLDEMVNHIYGRFNNLIKPDRPHMFERELTLYITYLREEIEKFSIGLSNRKQSYFDEFKKNLREGIDHYTQLPQSFIKDKWNSFIDELKVLYDEIEALTLDSVPTS